MAWGYLLHYLSNDISLVKICPVKSSGSFKPAIGDFLRTDRQTNRQTHAQSNQRRIKGWWRVAYAAGGACTQEAHSLLNSLEMGVQVQQRWWFLLYHQHISRRTLNLLELIGVSRGADDRRCALPVPALVPWFVSIVPDQLPSPLPAQATGPTIALRPRCLSGMRDRLRPRLSTRVVNPGPDPESRKKSGLGWSRSRIPTFFGIGLRGFLEFFFGIGRGKKFEK